MLCKNFIKQLIVIIHVFLFILFASNTLFATGPLAMDPCFAKKKMQAYKVPGDTVIFNVNGHDFRMKDECIPFSATLNWDTVYRTDAHNYYKLKLKQIMPGELWFKKDKKEFTFIASPTVYKGLEKISFLNTKGQLCKDGCKKRIRFGSAVVDPQRGQSYGTLEYGYPKKTVDPDLVGTFFRATVVGFKMVSGKDHWKPERPDINNFDISKFSYKDIIKAASKKGHVTETIRFDGNNDVENNPSHHKGSLKVTLNFGATCPSELKIKNPKMNEKYLFSETDPGELVIEAELDNPAGLSDEYFGNVEWEVPKKIGSVVKMSPSDGQGRKIKIKYEGLPYNNSDFGKTTIKASCGSTSASVDVKLFFPRGAINNPMGTVPNWYYYWQQTKAGWNTIPNVNIKYCGNVGRCAKNPKFMGYYDQIKRKIKHVNPDDSSQVYFQEIVTGPKHICICNFKKSNFKVLGMINPGIDYEGIDLFGNIVKHELTHKEHMKTWWEGPYGYYPLDGWVDLNGNDKSENNEWIDEDKDGMPDHLEDKQYPGTSYTFKSDKKQTYPQADGKKLTDEHTLTYYTAEQWRPGSAIKEDWAYPGSNWLKGEK